MAPELRQLEGELDAIERDAQKLVAGLTEEGGRWRANPDSWSVAECLDHLAATNRVYLNAMHPAAVRASEQGRLRRGPAVPGTMGRLFVRSLEPPVGFLKIKAPRTIRPRPAPPLGESVSSLLASQEEVRTFLRTNANLDLAGVSFPNPFLPGIRLSLATALHVIAAHERRHVWQAWQVRRMAESGVGPGASGKQGG